MSLGTSQNAKTEEERKEVLDLVLKTWNQFPMLRLGQLLENSVKGKHLFNIADVPLMFALREFERCNKKT